MENIRFYDTRLLAVLYQDYEFLNKKINWIQEKFHFFKPVSVYYYNTLDEMQRQIPIKLPEWIKGLSSTKQICILNPDRWKDVLENVESVSKIFVHEYVHVAVFNSFLSLCPCWLNEGLAQIISEQFVEQKDREIVKSFEYYKKSYEDDNFYYQSAWITAALIKKVGINAFLEHCVKCSDFENDKMVGEQALKEYICF